MKSSRLICYNVPQLILHFAKESNSQDIPMPGYAVSSSNHSTILDAIKINK